MAESALYTVIYC